MTTPDRVEVDNAYGIMRDAAVRLAIHVEAADRFGYPINADEVALYRRADNTYTRLFYSWRDELDRQRADAAAAEQ